MILYISNKPKWWNGRRAGLKIQWGRPRAGSSPAFGTIVAARDYDIRDSVDYLLYFLLGSSSYPTTLFSVMGALYGNVVRDYDIWDSRNYLVCFFSQISSKKVSWCRECFRKDFWLPWMIWSVGRISPNRIGELGLCFL